MIYLQFHCTGCAYLDMHGLIFETSICYCKDQPSREKKDKYLEFAHKGIIYHVAVNHN